MLEQAGAIDAGGDTGRTPSTRRRVSKERTQGGGAGGYRHTAPTPFSVADQKRIYIFQGNIVERTILFAKPAQCAKQPFVAGSPQTVFRKNFSTCQP